MKITKNKQAMAGIPFSKMGPAAIPVIFIIGLAALIMAGVSFYMLYLQIFG